MAIQAKVLMIFGGGKHGWTEDVYWQGVGDDTLADAQSSAKRLVLARRKLLNVNYNLEACRIESVDAHGDSLVTGASVISYLNVGAGPGLAAGACSNPWLALLMRFYSPEFLYAKNLLLRGLPDNWNCVQQTNTVPIKLVAAELEAFKSYLTELAVAPSGNKQAGPGSSKWCMRATDKPNGRQVAVTIGNVAFQAVTNKLQITTDAEITVAGDGGPRAAEVGDIVHVHNLRGPWAKGMNGDAQVVDVDGTTYTLNKVKPNLCTVSYNGRGTAWGVVHLLAPLDTYDISRVSVRKTGRAFFATRGRRRAQ